MRRPARTLSLCLARTSEVERWSILERTARASSFGTFRHASRPCDAAVRDRDAHAPDADGGRPHRARAMLGVRRVRRAAPPRRRVGSRPRRSPEPLVARARRAPRAMDGARRRDRSPARGASARDGGPLPRARPLHAPAPRRAHEPRAPRPQEETPERSRLIRRAWGGACRGSSCPSDRGPCARARGRRGRARPSRRRGRARGRCRRRGGG